MKRLRIVPIALSAVAIAGASMFGIFKDDLLGPGVRSGVETPSLARIGGNSA